MMMSKFLLVSAIFSAGVQLLFAQETDDRFGFYSERASVIGNARTVPAGQFILEAGASNLYFSRSVRPSGGNDYPFAGRVRRPSQALYGPGATLRVGLDRGVEFRILIPDRQRNFDDGLAESFVGAGGFGAKIELVQSARLTVALDFTVFLIDRVPSLSFSTSYKASDNEWIRTKASLEKGPGGSTFVTDANFGIAYVMRPSRGYEVFFGAEGGTGNRLDFRGDSSTQLLILSGLSHRLFEFLIADFGSAIRVTRGDQNAEIRTGLSVQL